MAVVDGLGPRALQGEVGVDGVGRAEEAEGLVDEVGAEVVPQATAGDRGLAPALADLRAEAVEAGFERQDLAERAIGDEAAQREEVGVPAAVVEHREDAAGARGETGEPLRLGQCEREGLVDDDVPAGRERPAGEVGVGVVRRGDDDEVEVGSRQDGVGVRQDRRVRQVGPHLGRVARRDGSEAQAGRGGDQGHVEGLAGVAVAEQRHVQGHGASRCMRHRRRCS